MGYKFDQTLPAQVRLDLAIERVKSHLSRPHLAGRQAQHLRMWVNEAAHAMFQMHPELREEGSLPRYFVAKAGRKNGLRGAALTEFVEAEYQNGTWWKLVPEDVLMGKPKQDNAVPTQM
jgi:hypothetical protein